MNTPHLVTLLDNYSETTRDVQQKKNARRVLRLIVDKPESFWRRSEFDPGHITASSWVVNPERTHVLLVNHLLFKKLLQLGGHCEEEDDTIFTSALREVAEESGLQAHIAMEHVFDIDMHPIGVRQDKNEPPHMHFDVRFVVEAPHVPPVPPEGESADIQWYPLADVVSGIQGKTLGEGLERMAHKALELFGE
jgi:ADP-ribose pyrophosphatase YjhB (NUDIX family)